MTDKNLEEFVRLLENRNQLKRITTAVDPDLEIAEITDRVVKKGGPALLFENVKGHEIPVLTNAYGSRERVCLSLGVKSINEIQKEIEGWLKIEKPRRLTDKVKLFNKLTGLKDMFPKTVSQGGCQEVVLSSEFSLDSLPVLKCWPEDGGKFITLPLVITKNPLTGMRNVGMYRMQVFDGQTTGMHWHQHKGGAQHYRIAEELGKRLDVAVAIGPDPAVTYAATAPLPDEMDEFLLAGFLRKKRVELVKAITVDMEVPANSQIVLEGYVDPAERREEGPFGDHTGYYSLADSYPVFHITCITHKKNPIYHASVVGPPPMEDFFLGKATERIFLPLLKLQIPEIVDINLPAEGVFHNLILVSIDKRYPGHANKVINSIWGSGQMMFSKIIIVVDKDVDVQNPREIAWKVCNSIDPQRDIIFTTGPLDCLDHSSSLPSLGSKMGVDATRKWKSEGFSRKWPEEIKMNDEIKKLVDEKWEKLGLC